MDEKRIGGPFRFRVIPSYGVPGREDRPVVMMRADGEVISYAGHPEKMAHELMHLAELVLGNDFDDFFYHYKRKT